VQGQAARVSRKSARGQFGGDAVEQRILLPFELPDGAAQRVGVAGLGVGVTAGLARLDVGQGRLGDERAQAHVLGLLLEEAELLLGHRQLSPDPLEPFTDVDESSLEE